MKTSHWSLVGYFAGVLFILVSAVRYGIIYSDLDRFVAYISTGTLILGISWLYSRQLKLSNTLDSLEEYMADNNKKEVIKYGR